MHSGPAVVGSVALVLSGVGVAGCVGDSDEEPTARSQTPPSAAAKAGRLTARPQRELDTAPTDGSGLQRVGPGSRALLYIPRGRRPAWLVVAFHGARGAPEDAIALLERLADEAGLLVLAPRSRGYTWDVGVGGFGPDVASINRLLEGVFARYAVDPKQIAVVGFSDGGSYALSLGLTNGDLFSAVIAFSPVFAAPSTRARGSPRIFIAHGIEDSIVRIGRTSREIVPRLRARGYPVRYTEFHGDHTVPSRIAREAIEWLRTGRP